MAADASPRDATGARFSSLEAWIRVLGGVLTVWLAVLTAVVEVFWVPLRLGEARAPVSVALAVAVNLVLPRFARWLTDSRLAPMWPALAWFGVVLIFAPGTAEGDVVLAGNDWVPLALLLAGSVAAGMGVFGALPRPRGR